jgi:type I restriction enzyme S subunit
LEQRKIAKILTTIDNLIEKTAGLITKYQAIKQGMIHDLFTRGVDEHGHLRPTYDEAPALYKPSALGQIPKEWDVAVLRDEIDILHGFSFQGEYFADSLPGEVLLVPGNFHRDGGLYFTESNIKYYTGPIPPNTFLTNGLLVIVMTDLSPRTLILGRVAEINLPFAVLHNQRIGLIQTKRSEDWDRRFLLFALNTERLRREVILTATGTTVRHTSPSRILANLVQKPIKDEQDRIAKFLDQVEQVIERERERMQKLRLTKIGLMQDLLTGKVRINADEPEEVPV